VPEANARPTLELPVTAKPVDAVEPAEPNPLPEPDSTRVEDLAEAWFPRGGWRSGADTPGWVLVAMWGLGVVALKILLERDDPGRSR